jgi:5-formyltetrahydrofolate cyclo-ligase
MMTKQALRHYYRDKRHSLSELERRDAAEAFLDRVLTHHLLDSYLSIACYLACDGELDMAPLIRYLWQHNKSVYLPVMQDDGLVFRRYEENSSMLVGPYGILEPKTGEVISLPDLVFMPLVAFDRFGNRLGMGKGFYDKTFQEHRSTLIGAAYQCQEAEYLPVDEWDVSLNGVVTELEFIQL